MYSISLSTSTFAACTLVAYPFALNLPTVHVRDTSVINRNAAAYYETNYNWQKLFGTRDTELLANIIGMYKVNSLEGLRKVFDANPELPLFIKKAYPQIVEYLKTSDIELHDSADGKAFALAKVYTRPLDSLDNLDKLDDNFLMKPEASKFLSKFNVVTKQI